MAAKKMAKKSPKKSTKNPVRKPAPRESPLTDLASVMAALKSKARPSTREGMARFGIPADHAWGITVAEIRALAKRIPADHALAAELWATGVYEARMLAAFVDEPARITQSQMDAWCRAFDNWAICDTVCFHLFDRTPHAFAKVTRWAGREAEFEKRAAFALLASLAVHGKDLDDAPFARSFSLIEHAASDPRNFVKKGVSWALRAIGGRRASLYEPALALAERLSMSTHPATRWVGKDALRDLSRPLLKRRFAKS